MNRPLVSACIITYNHEDYIVKCLEGALAQQVDFSYEIVIGDDFSSDRTKELCLEYSAKFPGLIRYIRREKNLGMIGNWVATISDCKGEYIALCEGDDFWIDPQKLQKQVDFLKENNDYIIHSGNAKIVSDNDRNNQLLINCDQNKTYTIEDFYTRNNIATCTVMFKNNEISIPKYYSKMVFGDWFLYILLMHQFNMKIYRSSDVLSGYRIHSGGVTSQLSIEKKSLGHINQIKLIQLYLGNKSYSIEIQNELNYHYYNAFLTKFNNSNVRGAINIMIENFNSCTRTFPFKTYFRFFLKKFKGKMI